MNNSFKSVLNLSVLVASLGYFVDIYDLQLFNLIGKKSLGPLGLNLPTDLIDKYDYMLFLWQMGGMLLGGLVFGIAGDKLGRKSVLFSSILIYSLANIANGFVTNIEQYKIIRLIAGFGLSGELGAAITLVAEIMHKEARGWGTMIIVSCGALGAVLAFIITNYVSWQTSYFIGGGLGLLLLLLRVSTFESGMFSNMKEAKVSKGNFFMLLRDKNTFIKYIACILIGLPVWFVVGVLIKFSEQFAKNLGVVGEVKVGMAIMLSYIGLSSGDLLSGYLSQVMKSRKKVVLIFLFSTIGVTLIYLFAHGISNTIFYFLCFTLGFCTGYWALFVSIASEQFGTNIRATATITVPNFVRGALIPMVLYFKDFQKGFGITTATIIIGSISLLLSIVSTIYLKETFAKDLDYFEEK